MKRLKTGELALVLCAVFCALGALVCRFALVGFRFSAVLLMGLSLLAVVTIFLSRWAEKSRIGKQCKVVFHVMLSAAFFLFIVVEGLLYTRGNEDFSALPVDAVIVLGAGVNGEMPSLILQSRIDAATAYLALHPDVPVVLSGGQGPGEEITEAEAMRRGLTAAGVAEGRLLLEERSTSTAENFAFSKALLADSGVDTDTAVIAVITSDFHCFRAGLIAQRAELRTVRIPAKAPWALLNANYYAREFFALGKSLLLD